MTIPRRTIWLLLLSYLLAVLINLHHIALWCLPLAFGAAIWRARARQPLTSGKSRRWLRVGIVILLTLAVLIAFHTLNGVQAGATLLVCMGALKLSETTARRDWYFIISASLFLLLASCLDGQALWRLPLYAAELYLICVALYALSAAPANPTPNALFRQTGKGLITALPFALLLFLFVPRLSGSFWAVPRDDQAVTGLTDQMDPGAISQLAESNAPAARVRFVGPIPPVEQRYWRGFVLHSFDGRAWRRGMPRQDTARTLAVGGQAYSYEISMEPAPYPVLLALELPDAPPADVDAARMTDDHVVWKSGGENASVRYHLSSHPEHRDDAPLSDTDRERDLDQYARNRNPRSIELAQTLRAQSASDADFVQRALDYLRHGGFRYTLEPPTLNWDSIDDLLFNTREGFCGHYASAFALLMRAGGVPARVVTGYFGGVWNRYGNYLLLRQSDAHAWTEVWLDGSGWQRVDPTAVVSPSQLIESAASLGGDGSAVPFIVRIEWIHDLTQAWQAANAWWQDEFVGFDSSKQERLLGWLGFKQDVTRALTILLVASSVLWLAIVAWVLRPRAQRQQSDAVRRSWLMVERKFRQAAPARAAHEGVLSYAERVGRIRPEFASVILALARRYARLRYGPAAEARDAELFHRAARQLRVVARRD